jgi:hypothetical protein
MSNERPTSADQRALSAQERRKERAAAEALDSAFAARLADVTPRSGVDVAALQYEAGYRAGLAERHGALRLTQGFAALTAAAMLLAAASAWMNYEAFVGERQALLAALDAPATDDPKTAVVTDDGVGDADSTAEPAERTSAPPKRDLRPRGDDVIAAGAAMERRYLTPQLRFAGDKLQWKDLYDLSTEPVSTTFREPSGGGGPRPAPASPWSAGGPSSPWSAWPSSRQVDDLLEQGI